MPLDIVRETQQLLGDGTVKLMDVLPAAIRRLIHDRAWQSRKKQDGKPITDFEDLVTTPLPWGLETTVEELLHYCRKVPDVVQMINREVLNAEGKSVRQVAEETGLSKSAVNERLSGLVRTRKGKPQVNLQPGSNPATAAERIREKLGDEFANKLRDAL